MKIERSIGEANIQQKYKMIENLFSAFFFDWQPWLGPVL
jgi:hypothetical protein